MASEKTSVETRLVSGVEERGGWCPKSEKICAGFPDRVVLASHARIVFVETKAPDGKLAPLQARVHKALRALGFRVEVIWSPAEVDAFLEEFFG